jgi:cytochrome c peroxidase
MLTRHLGLQHFRVVACGTVVAIVLAAGMGRAQVPPPNPSPNPPPPAQPAPAPPQTPSPAQEPALPVKPATPEQIHLGEKLFKDPSVSGAGQVACATCHPKGGFTDNKTYKGMEVVKDGDPEGRSTPSLWGAHDSAPYSWAGGKTLRDNIKGIIVNRMKGKPPTDETLDAIVAYVDSLRVPDNPMLNEDGSPSAKAPAAAKRGWEVFNKASCNICHVPPAFTKPDNEDIGSGGSFSVPSLRTVSKTAPYFHDGRFPDLKSLLPAKLGYLQQLGVTDTLTDKEKDDLIAFLSIL